MGFANQAANASLRIRQPGILYGGRVLDPGSATLTTTYEGLIARVKSATAGKEFDQYVIAGASKAFTASKDTYVYVDGGTGAIGYAEVANNATKPLPGGGVIPANSQFLAKVVTDGSRVVAGGVTDLANRTTGAKIHSEIVPVSFVTADQGSYSWWPPMNGTLLCGFGIVTTVLGGTDAGTVTFATTINNVSTAVTGGVMTFPLSSAVGTIIQMFPTALNRFLEAQPMTITTAKTTTGGKAQLTLIWEEEG